MTLRIASCLLGLLALGACAAAETHQIARASWQDDPDTQWVINNELDIIATTKCPRGYDVASKDKSVEDGRHVVRWTISCIR
jgi:hypothetical protein